MKLGPIVIDFARRRHAAVDAAELEMVERYVLHLIDALADTHALDIITGDHCRYRPLVERLQILITDGQRLALHLREQHGAPAAGNSHAALRGGGRPTS